MTKKEAKQIADLFNTTAYKQTAEVVDFIEGQYNVKIKNEEELFFAPERMSAIANAFKKICYVSKNDKGFYGMII